MTTGTEDLLRRLAPAVLGVVVRRCGDFADAEDAVQEALVAAATSWPVDGEPANPTGWLVRVASRRLADQRRRDDARRRREDLAASWALAGPEPAPGDDDSLALLFLCCHPALPAASAIPLTLRAVGGLTTREIAVAFLVPETTMAQRISRAKAKLQESGATFSLPAADERDERLRSVRHVLYLLFNEGYATSGGPELARADLSSEAIRLTRLLREAVPDDPEVTGLLALMLLTDARRPARTDEHGELVPLAEQDRGRWDRQLVGEGMALLNAALTRGRVGEYQLQAAIAAAHDRAPSHDETAWAEIASLYALLEQVTGNPIVTLNRAVAVAMGEGPDAGLDVLEGVRDVLGEHHRFHSVRGQLLERAGRDEEALEELRRAVATTNNVREQRYLIAKAARVGRR